MLAVVTGTVSGIGKALHEALFASRTVCISIARASLAGKGERHIPADLKGLHDRPAKLAQCLTHDPSLPRMGAAQTRKRIERAA